MNKWILLSLGGILGTLARYLMGAWVPELMGTTFPFGTLAVNLSACFLIGIFDSLAQTRSMFGPSARIFFMTGFCGAYSTFSTWMLESSNLINDGEMTLAFINIFASGILGFILFRLGVYLGGLL